MQYAAIDCLYETQTTLDVCLNICSKIPMLNMTYDVKVLYCKDEGVVDIFDPNICALATQQLVAEYRFDQIPRVLTVVESKDNPTTLYVAVFPQSLLEPYCEKFVEYYKESCRVNNICDGYEFTDMTEREIHLEQLGRIISCYIHTIKYNCDNRTIVEKVLRSMYHLIPNTGVGMIYYNQDFETNTCTVRFVDIVCVDDVTCVN